MTSRLALIGLIGTVAFASLPAMAQDQDLDPENTMVMFGLAKEYEKLGHHAEIISLLETYVSKADDEGNAYGMLAKAYEQSGNREKAIR